jgi:hypothetical protein
MLGDNSRERTIGVAPARLPDNWGGYLAGQFVSPHPPSGWQGPQDNKWHWQRLVKS